MKLDILAFGAHPDDVELGAGGTVAKCISEGKKIGIVDITAGELGTRGDVATRAREAAESAKLLGISVRENLGLPDGFFNNSREYQLPVITMIRRYQPEIILANAITDRHPDHGKGASLIEESCFLSGLMKIETNDNGKKQEAWRPRLVLHYIQDRYIRPDVVIDITAHIEKKMESIKAFRSQFFDTNSKEKATYISSEMFLESLYARAMEYGKNIGVKYSEGFTCSRMVGVKGLDFLI